MSDGRTYDVIKKGSSVVSACPTTEVTFEPIDNTLFNYLLWRTYGDIDSVNKVHRLPVKEVMEYLKIDRISKLQSSLERLGKGSMMIDYLDEASDEPRSMYVHYLSSDVSRTGNGMLVFAFDPILVTFIYEPKVYALISVGRVRDLRTTAAQKLYEMMSLQFRKKSPVWRTTVEEMRALLQVGSRYARFDNFRTHVIEKAVAEVNAIAEFDVLVDYVRGGQGGGVVEIVFKAVSKSHKRLIEAASVKSIGARRRKVDDTHTVDMLDGMTFEERGGPAELTAEAVEKAREAMPEGGDVNVLVSEWREINRGRVLSNPDQHFLAWLELRLGQESDPLLKDIDGDIFGSLLGGRD